MARKGNTATTKIIPSRQGGRKGFTMQCLELLEEATLSAGDLLGAFLASGYGASYGKIMRRAAKNEIERERREAKREEEFVARQRYYSMLYKLKKDGLIKEEKSERRHIFTLTPEGKRKLIILRKKAAQPPTPAPRYDANRGTNLVLVIFDVPEHMRGKRAWLRAALFFMGLTLVQKSVWMGKVKIPKRFLDDLADMKLVQCVEVFEITKTGTLRALHEAEHT